MQITKNVRNSYFDLRNWPALADDDANSQPNSSSSCTSYESTA